MNKSWLIFKHEFLQTIRRTGFIILTLSLPVISLLTIGIFNIISGLAKPPAEVPKIGFVDQDGSFGSFTSQGRLTLLPFDTPQAANAAFASGEVSQYFIIPKDFVSTGMIQVFLSQKELAPSDETLSAVRNFISSNLLAGSVAPNIITRIQSPIIPITTTLTSTGEVAPQQAGYVNFIVPGIFSFLMAISLITSATYVLRSLGEEKENRLMEILVSSISTRQLLTGKVLGLGAAGLAQVVFWAVVSPVILRFASSSIGGILSSIKVPLSFWIIGIVYFILGYLFIATISAGIASVSSSVQEAQGISGMYTIFTVSPFWFLSLLLLFPNNPAWMILTVFPLTAPVTTMMRLGLIGVPAWQIGLSLAVLALCVFGGLIFASRLLRAYMLTYGKRPGLGVIIQALRNSS